MIEPITRNNIKEAGKIYSCSWQASHQNFCSKDFLMSHTSERQAKVLSEKIKGGWNIYIHNIEKKRMVSLGLMVKQGSFMYFPVIEEKVEEIVGLCYKEGAKT